MQVRKALTFRASSIGDCLMAKHFLENVHAAYPEARCGIVVAGRGAMIRDLLAAYPWIEVIEANRRNPASLFRLWKRFQGSDIVLTQYGGKGTGAFAFPSKLAARLLANKGGLIGFNDSFRWNRYLYDKLLPASIARAPRLLDEDALVAAGIPVSVPELTLTASANDQIFEMLGIKKHGYIAVHLFAGSEGRGMSQGKRQELIDALSRALPDVPLVFTGSESELPHLEALTLPPSSVLAAGKLSLQELMTLITESRGMVSIGTGPSHIASHLGTKVLVLVTCAGVAWCGEDQFGANAGELFTRADLCGEHHDYSIQPPLCIEGVDVNTVAARAKQSFRIPN